MKKILSLVLAITLVLGSFSFAFAADESEYAEAGALLESLQVLKGDGQGNLDLNGNLTREQMMIMVARLMGKEDVAESYPFEAPFEDVDNPYWAPIIAWAYAEGITNGIGNNLFGFGQPLTVAQLQTFLLRALGYDNAWENREALVEEAGLMAGLEANADAVATRGFMAAMTVNTLKAKVVGKETTLATELGIELPNPIESVAAPEAVTVKAGEEVELPATVVATYEDGTTAEVAVTWEAVDTSVPGEVTVNGTVEGYEAGVVATVVVTEPDLAVESVTANNLKEIEIKFNKAVDEEIAENEANYTVNDVSTGFTATLSEDGTTVTLTENSTNAAFGANQDEITVEVAGDIFETAYETTITLFDATVPVAQSIELVGPNKFKVVFSEPMDAGSVGTIEVENGIYGISDITVDGTNEVLVELSASSLQEDDYKVTVENFYDFAGFKALKKEFTLAYTKDTTAPVATIKEATQTKVVIKFNKAVTTEDGSAIDETYFYHTFTSYNPSSAAVTSTDGTEYTLDFTNYPLPEGTIKVVVDYDANDNVIVDEWGNAMDGNAVLYADITADVTAPTITKHTVEYNSSTDKTLVKVYFSEDVVGANNADNYTVKDADGEEVSVTAGYSNADDEYVATLTYNGALKGAYTIEVKDIEDKALEANKLQTVTLSINVDDLKAPSLAAITAKGVNGSDVDYIYVTFPEDMATSGEYSVLDKDNYLVSGSALGEDDKIEIFGTGTSKVRITLDDHTAYDVENGLTLTIARVADAQGNKSALLAQDVNVIADTAPVVTAVKTVDEKTIEITVDQPLTTVTADGFVVTKDAYDATLASISWSVNDSDETVITGVLKSNVQLTGSDDTAINLFVVANKLKSETGKYMAQGATTTTDTTVAGIFYPGYTTQVAITDGFAPSFDADSSTTTVAAVTSNASISLAFDENVTTGALDESTAALDLVVKYDGDVLTPLVDYTTAVAGNTVTITIKVAVEADKVITIEAKDTVNYLTDLAGNAINDFSTEIEVQ